RTTPVQVSGLGGVAAMAGGDLHSLALASDGTIWAWGLNSSGQLGDGSTTSRRTPVQVSGLSGVVAVAAGSAHSLALGSGGTVRAWGLNNYGQLGDGTTVTSGCYCRSTPVQVSGLSGVTVTAVDAGSRHSLAVAAAATPASTPTAVVVEQLVGSSGGTVGLSDQSASVLLPSNAVPDGTIVRLAQAPAPSPAGPNRERASLALELAGPAFEISARAADGTSITNLGQPAQVTLAYTGTPPSSVASWDGAAWQALPSSVDTGAMQATGTTTHFGLFAAIRTLAPTPTPAPAPTVTSVSPSMGPGRGGTTLTIGGDNFQDGATVSVGDWTANSATFGSASSLTAVTPADGRTVGDVNGNGSVTSLDALCILRAVASLPATTSCPAEMLATTVDVMVTNLDGQSGTLASAFTYRHADVNGNGSITSLDALCTLRQVASLPATTSCPAPPGSSPTPSPTPAATPTAGTLPPPATR
ncbi:MAG: IPT/TIG domain-containing protein, partial [Chloroflexi bacterium]|nr:IPT/TIG domain-containing protein [Chloroflexota bacterium]